MKIAMYDPPSGWMCGFPRPYKPLPGESVADTLRRDGYPEKMDPNWAGDHCRFWDSEQEPRTEFLNDFKEKVKYHGNDEA